MSSACFRSQQLKAEAQHLGFSRCGVAPAEPVPDNVRQHYLRWLRQGGHADMHYLENNTSQRFSPSLLVPGVQTIVSLAISYHPGKLPTQRGLAWYAQGKDYHTVVRSKLRTLMHTLSLTGRCFADTAPVMEKYWAWRCGLGFVGRHTQLVIPQLGSAFFLGELFLHQQADLHDSPITPTLLANLCGTCHRCEQACPTGAINNSHMEAARCLSYLTIEYRGALPEWAKPHMADCFYGCDRCLLACPHLHATAATPIEEFCPTEQLLALSPDDWQTLTPEQYRSLFKSSAVKRTKYEGLLRNIGGARK